MPSSLTFAWFVWMLPYCREVKDKLSDVCEREVLRTQLAAAKDFKVCRDPCPTDSAVVLCKSGTSRAERPVRLCVPKSFK